LGGDEEGDLLSKIKRKKEKKKEENEQMDIPVTFPSMNVDQGRI